MRWGTHDPHLRQETAGGPGSVPMTDTANTNLLWASAPLAGLAGTGVRHVVISPGSRSTPLVLACERQPGLTSHVLVDERCAGFFALGLAKAERRPVALICTS